MSRERDTSKYNIYEDENQEEIISEGSEYLVEEVEESNNNLITNTQYSEEQLRPFPSASDATLLKKNKKAEKLANKFNHSSIIVAIFKSRFLRNWFKSLLVFTILGNIVNWIVIQQDSRNYWEQRLTMRQASVVLGVTSIQTLFGIVLVIWLIVFSIRYGLYHYKSDR